MVLILSLVLSFILKQTYSMYITLDAQQKFERRCLELVADPCFSDDMVIGPDWTVYYSWNEKLENGCLTLSFQKATESVIRRFQRTMQAFLKTEIQWSKARLYINLTWTDKSEREALQVLLVPIPTAKGDNEGLFQAVPKIKKNQRIASHAETVPRIAMAMKLFSNGRYLIIADCFAGTISLLVRRDQKHTWKEIDDIVDSFTFDESGFPACKYNLRKRNK